MVKAATASAPPEWAEPPPPALNPDASADELPGGELYAAAWSEAEQVGDRAWRNASDEERIRRVVDALVSRRRAGEQAARDGVTVRGDASGVVTAAELLRRRFAEQRWAVRGIVPEGLTILAAKPKLGKSWLMLGVGVAISAGGRALGLLDVEAGPVLYMALEDTQRRLQSRLVSILDDGADPPPRLELTTTWRRIDAGGLDDLRDWLTTHPGARLVIVDTLARIRPDRKRKDTRLYDDDYNELVGLKALADEFSCAVVVVHHLRKAKADDPIDQLNASTGMSGAADAILILERGRLDTDAKLHVQGRDVEEAAHALRWWPGLGTWTIVDPALVDTTIERAEMLDYLARADGPRTPSIAAVALGKNLGSTKRLMWDMGRAGQIQGGGRGGYTFLPPTYETGEPSEPNEPSQPASVRHPSDRRTDETGQTGEPSEPNEPNVPTQSGASQQSEPNESVSGSRRRTHETRIRGGNGSGEPNEPSGQGSLGSPDSVARPRARGSVGEEMAAIFRADEEEDLDEPEDLTSIATGLFGDELRPRVVQ